MTIVGAMIATENRGLTRSAPDLPRHVEKYREVGKKLKAAGRPIGQTLGHTFGDAPTFNTPICRGAAPRSRRQDRQPQQERDK